MLHPDKRAHLQHWFGLLSGPCSANSHGGAACVLRQLKINDIRRMAPMSGI
jgi:hypothetical protein